MLSIPSEPSPLPQRSSYLGRSQYVPTHVPINEEDAAQYQPTSASPAQQSAASRNSNVEGISRSLRDSLVRSFLNHCWPWMPLMNKAEILQLEPGSLLSLSVLVAGSKVSTSPRAVDIGEQCYEEARRMFLGDEETDAVRAISAMIFLQWWNPSGPEHVSINNSSFWLRMCVALAHQIGLHKEPDARSSDRKLRRRLWWTLVVGWTNCQQVSFPANARTSIETARLLPAMVDHERSTCLIRTSVH